MIQVVYGLPEKCVRYMGPAERSNNITHTLPIAQQIWAVFLQATSFISLSSIVLF